MSKEPPTGNQQFQAVGLNLLPTGLSTSGRPHSGLTVPICNSGIGLSDGSGADLQEGQGDLMGRNGRAELPTPAPRLQKRFLRAGNAPSWESENPGAWALTVLLGYSLQVGDSKGLSRKRSLAMTKRPASTQKKLMMFAIRHNFYRQKTKGTSIVQGGRPRPSPGLPAACSVTSGETLPVSGLKTLSKT